MMPHMDSEIKQKKNQNNHLKVHGGQQSVTVPRLW